MGDVTDFDAYRKSIREEIEAKEAENEKLTGCPTCDDLLFMITAVSVTDVDSGGPYALVCQHCSEPVGSAFFFEEE